MEQMTKVEKAIKLANLLKDNRNYIAIIYCRLSKNIFVDTAICKLNKHEILLKEYKKGIKIYCYAPDSELIEKFK